MQRKEYLWCNLDVCVIAFLPHILDSSEAEREKYIETIKSVAG
jgi:hypothetical protein